MMQDAQKGVRSLEGAEDGSLEELVSSAKELVNSENRAIEGSIKTWE